MNKNTKKIIYLNDGSLTRMANKYRDLNFKVKKFTESRNETKQALRDRVLSEFDPVGDALLTRVIRTNSLIVSVNKETTRKQRITDMEAVFENISLIHDIPRAELDKIVEANTVEQEIHVTPAIKVE